MRFLLAACLSLLVGCFPEEDRPNFQEVQTIFNFKCQGRECHIGANPSAEGLDLGSELSINSTVGTPSRQNPGRTLVVAGNSGASYLYCKIKPGCGPIFGVRMPIDNEVFDEPTNLTSEEIETIRRWIDSGAIDDRPILTSLEGPNP
jgi:hypothetical protein